MTALSQKPQLSMAEHRAPYYTEAVLRSIHPSLPLVMTEKDAVKCREFAGDSWYYLQIDAVLDGDLAGFIMKITGLKAPQGGAEEKK